MTRSIRQVLRACFGRTYAMGLLAYRGANYLDWESDARCRIRVAFSFGCCYSLEHYQDGRDHEWDD
jgi:hypothetical protein